MWRLAIQNDPKSSITERRRNKTKYLTRNSIRLKILKKSTVPKPVKSLGYIKPYYKSYKNKLVIRVIRVRVIKTNQLSRHCKWCFILILILKPHSRIMKVPNLPKRVENQSGSAGGKLKNEHDKTKILWFKSWLKKSFSLND